MGSTADLRKKELAQRMRDEWDRRVLHDYRYWMGDGVKDDVTMFNVGKRDMDIILDGISLQEAGKQTALEVGCGVGRLVYNAAQHFARVIGVDVSDAAIDEAKRLLNKTPNAEVVLGNGTDLSFLSENSIDFAFSFASLSSMPVEVIAGYLVELSRVLKLGSLMRLQVYLGRPQGTFVEDTIAIRSFEKDRFVAAVNLAGFRILDLKELVLSFEISDHEAGYVAHMVTLQKAEPATLSSDELRQVLLPGGEQEAKSSWNGSKTEYLMAITRATQLLDDGKKTEAKTALEFAITHFGDADPKVQEIVKRLEEGEQIVSPTTQSPQITIVKQTRPDMNLGECFSAENYERNLTVLKSRFPHVAAKLEQISISQDVFVSRGDDGNSVLHYKTIALDNIQKPVRAAEVWVERTISKETVQKASRVVIVGFAAGYHLQALCKAGIRIDVVIEPHLEVLKAALGLNDLTGVLSRISLLLTSTTELRETESLEGTQGNSELYVHPQTQLVARECVDECKKAFWSTRGLRELRPAVAVVGPLYGGSLPIAKYTELALRANKQRVYYYDVSSHLESYRSITKVLRDQGRINVIQSQYVEMISDMVVQGIEEKPVDILICLAQAPLSPKALTKIREKGIITVMWFVEDCLRFTGWQSLARYYDYMFLIQKEPFPSLVEAAGAGRAFYLPVGCAPQIHTPLSLSEEEEQRWGSEVSFVGAGYNNRQQTFASMSHLNFKIWGTQWPSGAPFDRLVQEEGRRLTPEEYVKIFNATKVNINLHSSVERDGVEPDGDFVNPRTFELASCGAFQLVDKRKLLPELFVPGEEVITFEDRYELEDKIHYYLKHPDERAAVAQKARARVLRDHTYEQRIRDMLGYIYVDRYAELSRKAAEGPWPRVFEAAKKYPELEKRYERLYENGEDPTLNGLVKDIQVGKGALESVEMKLLFLHHIRKLVNDINDKREGKIEG